MYQIIFEKSAQKKLYKLPAAIRDKIVAKVKALAADPRPSGCMKLMGGEGCRIRVGDYRVIYLIEDGKLTVLIIDVGIGKISTNSKQNPK